MRELKFRAWDKIAKKYYKVVNLGVGSNSWQKLAENRTEPPYQPDTGKNKFYPDIVEVEQYTGLNDKNGKEIYEGDILKIEAYRCNYLVVYRDFDCCFWGENNGIDNVHLFNSIPHAYEVIGNIHENPELLEEEQ